MLKRGCVPGDGRGAALSGSDVTTDTRSGVLELVAAPRGRRLAENLPLADLRELSEIADKPAILIGDIPIRLPEDIVEDVPDDEASRDLSPADLVTAVAAADHDGTAVSWNGVAMTFGELDSLMVSASLALPGVTGDSGLTMALMTALPGLTEAGPGAFDEVLSEIRANTARYISDQLVTTEGIRKK